MASTIGLTLEQCREIETEVEKRMRGGYICNCGDGERGHSPDCSWIYAADQEWDYHWEEVREEKGL